MTDAREPNPSPPLLRAKEARLLVDGVVVAPSLSLCSEGDRVLVVGETGPLVRVLAGGVAPGTSAGSACVSAGSFEVGGVELAAGVALGHVGVAFADPPLPVGLTVAGYLHWSARLGGVAVSDARNSVAEILAELGLERLSSRSLVSLTRLERRALSLASALVLRPEVLVLEDPMRGLDAAAAAAMFGALDLATRSRRVVVAVDELLFAEPYGALFRGANWVVWLRDGAVVHEGPPDAILGCARAYVVRGTGPLDLFAEELTRAGVEVRGGGTGLVVLLPADVEPRVVVAAAARVGVGLTGLVPLA